MKIVILALSYKNDGICLAGIDIKTYKFVRLGHAEKDICHPMKVNELLLGNHLIEILDVVEVDAVKMQNDGCQTENYSFIKFKSYLGKMEIRELEKIYEKLPKHKNAMVNYFYKVPHKYMEGIDYSLGIFKVEDLEIEMVENAHGNLRPNSHFKYNGREYSYFRTTDSSICGYPIVYGPAKAPLRAKEAYVVISLPPASDNYTRENGYFKYISGVIVTRK